MDPGTIITTAVTSVKGLTDIARGLKSLKNLSEVQAVAVDLNEQILNIQQQLLEANIAMSAQADRIRDLEGQLARTTEWNAQKLRYKLATPFPGCMVYALQKSKSEGEAPHYICAACYQRGRLSILQGRPANPGSSKTGAFYFCPDPGCHSEAITRFYNVTAPKYFEDIQPRE
jgi:hypothetical protein